MAAKLKNLKVTKVDFVDEGANPDAHIRLFKNREAVEGLNEGEAAGTSGVLKRMIAFIAKAAGMGKEEIEDAVEEIQKGNSASFGGKMNEMNNRNIADEMWDVCFALQSSLCSILNDEDLDWKGMASAMQESLDEFYGVVKGCVAQWSQGSESGVVRKEMKPAEEELDVMRTAKERMEKAIEKASSDKRETEISMKQLKGEQEMAVKIDKSRMSPAELAFYESIEKRYGIEDMDTQAENSSALAAVQQEQSPAETFVRKSDASAIEALPAAELSGQAGGVSEAEDIYKGLHPAVKAELENLREFREAAEDKEFQEIAKKYEIIGKNQEELVPMLKGLKAMGGTAYNDMIAVLDHAVDAVEKSGVFSEIGRIGFGGAAEGSAWAEADAKAAELMKSRTGISKAQALDEIFMKNPELAERCEKEE